MKGDLHIHSYYSDGIFSPAEVMLRAKAAGCEMVSLTDHDSVDGLCEAREQAEKLGMKFVDGIEFSCYHKMEIHVLGYGMNTDCSEFIEFTEKQQQCRRDRSVKLLGKLAEYGIVIPQSEFEFKVRRGISRSHIALAMVHLGYEPDFYTAMDKWLCYGAPTYVPNIGATPAEAIRVIHAAGGKAVLAHPVRINGEVLDVPEFIRRLAGEGLDGIEAVYKRSSEDEIRKFENLAEELGLFVTAGADFHGGAGGIIPRELDSETTEALLHR